MEQAPKELLGILDEIRQQLASLSARVAQLEHAPIEPATPATPAPQPEAAPAAAPETITEQEILAIAATLAAYLGVQPHIRQIRLISSRAWAEEGRVTIQASHRLHS